ncbi:unnamed protein product [Rotaria sordida]|uniref:MULE transposase domain-containing protein n=1 Tax=Rotaria sordida TaxID=392033 RepID=A0A814LPP2_9BILA|nr:unnamed protein product [Rotaria sordida]CAF1076081.1 unnamed protein product [Rotaria sordida]
MLVIDNYVFKLNKTTTTTKYYRCEHRECGATVHTDINDVLLKTKGDHCHVIEPEKNKIRIFKQVVKERAINESTPIPKIYEEESAKMILSPATIAILPSQREMKLKGLAIGMNQIFDPSTIISDFEQGLGEAISSEFPSSNHIGCYFHFTQAVYRHIQQFGLSSAYINNENIRMICRKLMALALLPSSVVLKSFEDLYEIVLLASSSELGSLRPLFDYFENYWIKRIDINKWNVYGFRIRTNNNAEGFHNRLNLRIAKYHPNIWTFIRCIQGEENRFNHVLIQMIGGLAARLKTATTNAIQQRIDTLYLRYQNNDITVDELLNGLSYVVAKNTTSKRKK